MRKTMKYETPEIEITRFDIATSIMDYDYSPGGGSDEVGDDDFIDDGGDDWISVPDLEL